MAISAATQLSDFSGFLTPEESAPIFDDAVRQSVAQRMFRRVPLGINGQKIPVVTSRPTANWTGEASQKHGTSMGLGLKYIEPKKLTSIAVMSAEVIRANPGNFTAQLRTGLAGAFATAFDYAAFFDVGGDGTGTGPFDHYLAETTKSVTFGDNAVSAGGVHADLVDGLTLLVDDSKKLTGFALDDTVEPLLWGAVDSNGRPLYTDLPTDDTSQAIARPGRLLNRMSFMGEGVGNGDVVAFGGDFTKGAWGAVGGISFRVSTEATVTIDGTLTSLFENNLVAVLAEAEYGFVLADVDAFVKYEVESDS
jgi:HK97 family phage major capsid protein